MSGVLRVERANTILYCQRWPETVAFYQAVFGFAITHQTDWFVEFQLTPGAYLSVADASRASIASAGGQGITLAWQVADVRAAHSALQQRGLAVTPLQRKWGAQLFYLHDPAGHRIELWQPLTT